MEGIATIFDADFGPFPGGCIEVVDLVWKGLRHLVPNLAIVGDGLIEVVDLVWKGLRRVAFCCRAVPCELLN